MLSQARDPAPAQQPAPPPLVTRPAPTREPERIQSLDVVRGFALFGILFVNIEDFAMVNPARYYPSVSGGEGPLNHYIWVLTYHLADTKFIAIFTMLFGAGIALTDDRRRARRQRWAMAYYRRMLFLMALGFAHHALLWDGDILYYYGVCGLALYFAPRLPTPGLFIIGFTLLALYGILYGSGQMFGPSNDWHYEIAAHAGSWRDEVAYRFREPLLDFLILPIFFGVISIGHMLIGMGLLRVGFLSGEISVKLLAALPVFAITAGMGLVAWGTEFTPGFDSFTKTQAFIWGSFLMSIAYIALAVGMTKLAPRLLLIRAVANVGRMALTNYLTHSVICTTIFYGYGFGLYEELDRVAQVGLVLAICTLQLIFSTLWLKWFLMGPVEWLWRCATYLRPQPFRRPTVQAIPESM